MTTSSSDVMWIEPKIMLWIVIMLSCVSAVPQENIPSVIKGDGTHPTDMSVFQPFDPSVPTNFTVQVGTHAYLLCRINPLHSKLLGNKSVSWVRRRDSQILTVDRVTFVGDERFAAFFTEETWSLQIKYVQVTDNGTYECQLSTEPKLSNYMQLNVIVPKTEIVGETEMYVKAGSTLSLRCVISRCLQEPAYIFWYHDNKRILDHDKSAVDINIERVGNEITLGMLTIYNTKPKDSGNYSCSPSNLASASIILHVLSDNPDRQNGEEPAAMQGRAVSILALNLSPMQIFALILLLVVRRIYE